MSALGGFSAVEAGGAATSGGAAAFLSSVGGEQAATASSATTGRIVFMRFPPPRQPGARRRRKLLRRRSVNVGARMSVASEAEDRTGVDAHDMAAGQDDELIVGRPLLAQIGVEEYRRASLHRHVAHTLASE